MDQQQLLQLMAAGGGLGGNLGGLGSLLSGGGKFLVHHSRLL